MWVSVLAFAAKLFTGGRTIMAVGGIIGLVFSYMKGRGDAWTQAEALAHKQWQARVEAVNKLNEEYRAEVLEALQQNQELQEEVDKLNEEASKDPDATNKSLGVSSVRRLNKIK